MKLYLVRDGVRTSISTSFLGADHALLAEPCPECGSKPVKIAGTGKRPSKDDRAWEADARAICCGAHMGIIRAEPNTLFGVREDEAVSRLGVRIY